MSLPFRPMSPAELLRYNQRLWTLWAEAGAVISMRMLGMAGLWAVGPQENARMVSEKLTAFAAGARAGTGTALKGGSGSRIAGAALGPVARRARQNRKRLMKSGPKGAI